jgi:hypothetical protein
MPASYYRSCRTCGRRIQLRKMPGGQWVAFEGFDTLHDCSRKSEHQQQQPGDAGAKADPLEGLGFDSVNIPEGFRPTTTLTAQEKRAPRPKRTEERRRPSRRRSGYVSTGAAGSSRTVASDGRQPTGQTGSLHQPAIAAGNTALAKSAGQVGGPLGSGRLNRESKQRQSVLLRPITGKDVWEVFKGIIGLLFLLLLIYGACFKH